MHNGVTIPVSLRGTRRQAHTNLRALQLHIDVAQKDNMTTTFIYNGTPHSVEHRA
jgi:hypothetical protein